MFDQHLIRKQIKQLRAVILADPASKEPVWHQWVAELVDLQRTFPEHSTIDFHDAEFAGWDGKKPLEIAGVVEAVIETDPEPAKPKSKRKTPPLKVTVEQTDAVYDQGLEQYQAALRAEREAEKSDRSMVVQPRHPYIASTPILSVLSIKPSAQEGYVTSGTGVVVDARETHTDILASVLRPIPSDDHFEMLEATLLAYMAYVRGDEPLADTLHDIASRREHNGQWMAKTLKMAKVLRPAYHKHLSGLWDPDNQSLELDRYDHGTVYITVL